jgi:hypothetical protein
MAPRKTRAAAKAQTETSPSTDIVENPFDAEDQTPELEHDSEPEEVDEEDMSKAKGTKSKKGGKKKGKKAKTDAPEAALAQVVPEIVEETVAAATAMEDGEFNAAAMPVLRSPKKELEPEAIGKYRHIASTYQTKD